MALLQAGPFGKTCVIVTSPRICSEVLTNERMLRVRESTKRMAWVQKGLFLKPKAKKVSQEEGKCASIWTNCLMLTLSFHHRTTRRR